jgi:hypothetical protein
MLRITFMLPEDNDTSTPPSHVFEYTLTCNSALKTRYYCDALTGYFQHLPAKSVVPMNQNGKKNLF